MNSDQDAEEEAPTFLPDVGEIKKRAQAMSTHDLLMDPSTLTAGLCMLSSLGGFGAPAPVPGPSKKPPTGRTKLRAPTPTVASSSETEQQGTKKKKRKVKKESSATETAHRPAPSGPEEVELLSECSVSSINVLSESEAESASSGHDWLQAEKGKIQLEELQKRFAQGEGEKVNRGRSLALKGSTKDMFGLDKSGVFLRGVFPDYDEKLRLYEENEKRIEKLTQAKALEHFNSIKGELQDIFEGNLPSERMDYYCDGDMDSVNALNISYPFPNDIFMLIASEVGPFLLPSRSRRRKYLDFIHKVMISEALIRIYGVVNGVSYSHAEKEMRFGAEYDGPVPKILRGRAIERGERKSPKKAKRRKKPAETVSKPLEAEVELEQPPEVAEREQPAATTTSPEA